MKIRVSDKERAKRSGRLREAQRAGALQSAQQLNNAYRGADLLRGAPPDD
jgi:hypothetical protein